MRPTVGVDQTSCAFGETVSFAPHVHFVFAVSGPPGGGWYSHCAMHVPPSAVVPASPWHVGGSGRHLPSEGSGSLQPASRPPSLVPPSLFPSAGSQYSFGAQSAPLRHALPGVTHWSKRHTVPPLQHVLPQTFAAVSQHWPPFMQTPPLQSLAVLHPASPPKGESTWLPPSPFASLVPSGPPSKPSLPSEPQPT